MPVLPLWITSCGVILEWYYSRWYGVVQSIHSYHYSSRHTRSTMIVSIEILIVLLQELSIVAAVGLL